MRIYNSLTKKVETFKPIDDKKITIYVCGITPYDTTHLGHASTYIFFDALIRYLKFKGYQVTYTQNITDINDRDKDVLQRAREQNISWENLAKYWTGKFLEDMEKLNWISPTYYLKASTQIDHMIKIIKTLIQKGYAYQKNDSVYFDIKKFPRYGKLSKFPKSKMLKVAKDFEEDLKNPDKKHPLDITLWRASPKNQPTHIPSFDSPFGKGRPGWHIECSAMSMYTLGQQLDIHGGGADLIFPHHEAEIAQSEGATGKIPFVKYWIHTQPVYYKNQKMSKSKGNLVMVSDLLKEYSPNSIRWLLLSRHFTKKWEYKEDDLKIAQKNVELVESVILACPESNKEDPDVALRLISVLPGMTESMEEFTQILDNDLNTPKALEILLKLAKAGRKEDLKKFYQILGFKINEN